MLYCARMFCRMRFNETSFFVAIIVLFNLSFFCGQLSTAQAHFPTQVHLNAHKLIKKISVTSSSNSAESKSDRNNVMPIKSQNQSESAPAVCNLPLNEPNKSDSGSHWRYWLDSKGCGNVSFWVLGRNDQSRVPKGVTPVLAKLKTIIALKPSRFKAIAYYPLSHALAHLYRIEQNDTLSASKPNGEVKDLTSECSEDSSQTSPARHAFNYYNLALFESIMTGHW